ncbi:MAG: hypothetical protein QX203_04075 [Methylococcaceae bacterium]
MLNNYFRPLPFITLLALLPGCTLWTEIVDEQIPPGSFSSYAETVFRRQNSAISQLMMLSLDELENNNIYAELLAAEKSLQKACAPLNSYAEKHQEGESTSLLLSARVGKSINACDSATTTMEALLKKLDQATAD